MQFAKAAIFYYYTFLNKKLLLFHVFIILSGDGFVMHVKESLYLPYKTYVVISRLG